MKIRENIKMYTYIFICFEFRKNKNLFPNISWSPTSFHNIFVRFFSDFAPLLWPYLNSYKHKEVSFLCLWNSNSQQLFELCRMLETLGFMKCLELFDIFFLCNYFSNCMTSKVPTISQSFKCPTSNTKRLNIKSETHQTILHTFFSPS